MRKDSFLEHNYCTMDKFDYLSMYTKEENKYTTALNVYHIVFIHIWRIILTQMFVWKLAHLSSQVQQGR